MGSGKRGIVPAVTSLRVAGWLQLVAVGEESVAKETERRVYRILLGKPYSFGALARLVAEEMECD